MSWLISLDLCDFKLLLLEVKLTILTESQPPKLSTPDLLWPNTDWKANLYNTAMPYRACFYFQPLFEKTKCLVFGLARLWAHDIIEEMHSGYQMHWYSRRLRENMLLERKGHFSSFDFKKENLLFFGCKWFVPKNLELFPSAWKNSTNTLVIGL